ncbi:hypothetical protein [Deinococcus enclensis]|uniref:HEAT repeat domain-containing protein n=1 Tax=Deinococcus enclensis TaxID=1049582 RepID=A0ABT9MEV2_9DEIO|nr:hypothetical protein [Deinococcus enclensis]MDP9765133.1 hypothetical protein [Deinococcus enclensis]
MTPLSFKTALHRGLGRALIHLQAQPDTSLQGVVLEALLHSTRIDHQCEGSGTTYLLEAARLAGLRAQLTLHLEAEVRDQISAGHRDTRDTEQLVDLLRALGEEGDERATLVLEQLLPDAVQCEDSFLEALTHGLMRARGEAGIRLVLQNIGGALEAGVDYDHPDFVLWQVERLFGPELVQDLPQWGEDDPRIARYFKRVGEVQHAPRQTLDVPESLEYDALLEWMGREPRRMGRLAINATDEAAHRFAQDLIGENEPTRLQTLLKFFDHRAFPLSAEPLLALTGHPDPEVVDLALGALRHVEHPDIRSLALTFLQARTHVTAAARLLRGKVQVGDELLLNQVMMDLEESGDDPELHRFVDVFVGLAEAQPSAALYTLLARSFEHQPCSLCREDMVRLLLEAGALPEWLEAEARLDVNDDLRELVNQDPVVTPQ